MRSGMKAWKVSSLIRSGAPNGGTRSDSTVTGQSASGQFGPLDHPRLLMVGMVGKQTLAKNGRATSTQALLSSALRSATSRSMLRRKTAKIGEGLSAR